MNKLHQETFAMTGYLCPDKWVIMKSGENYFILSGFNTSKEMAWRRSSLIKEIVSAPDKLLMRERIILKTYTGSTYNLAVNCEGYTAETYAMYQGMGNLISPAPVMVPVEDFLKEFENES